MILSQANEQAIAKINLELEQGKNDSYIQVIGQFLIQQIEKTPGAGEAILAEDKSIKKSLDYMKSEAKKKAVNGFAMFTPDEGFTLVLKYFGIAVEGMEAPEPKIQAPKKKLFDVKLNDLLKGES